MAWTAPASYSVSEIVTAAKLNTHIRDNLDYLKGNAGLITIANGVDVVGTLRASGNASPVAGAGVEFLYIAGTGYMLSYDRSGGVSRPFVYGASTMEWDIGPTASMYLDANRNLGIGTVAPATNARLHAVGAGGGFMFLSANAVTTLQTIAPNGTVTVGMTVWLTDRNNGAGAFVVGFNAMSFALSATQNYTNTDTMTLTLTAAGAITIQRTSGTNGSHQVNMMVLYY